MDLKERQHERDEKERLEALEEDDRERIKVLPWLVLFVIGLIILTYFLYLR